MSKKEEKECVAEKIEDALDEAVYRTQNAIYGERKSTYEDIPATMEDPNGFRKINKFATRRNISLKLVKTIVKKPKILFAILGAIVAVAVVMAIII